MTDKTYDVEYLEAGDTFEGSPLEQSYFISAVLGAGGEIAINGNKVVIKSLPKKESKKETVQAKAPVSAKPVEKVPEPVEAVEVVEEAPKVEEPKKTFSKPTFKSSKPDPKPKAAPAVKPSPEKE